MYACTYLFTYLVCVCESECVFVCARACECVRVGVDVHTHVLNETRRAPGFLGAGVSGALI